MSFAASGPCSFHMATSFGLTEARSLQMNGEVLTTLTSPFEFSMLCSDPATFDPSWVPLYNFYYFHEHL